MEFTIHHQILCGALLLGVIMGAVAAKTHFCTMGAVSDWINMEDTGRLRAWFLAIAVAMLGVAGLESFGIATIGNETFPPYRTPNFAWPRYLLGGLMFGVGMVLASGCGNKTLVRLGGGNLKSLVVLLIAAPCTYAMLWTDFYQLAFNSWIAPLSVDLGARGWPGQALGQVLSIGNPAAGFALGGMVLIATLAAREFRSNFDQMFSGIVVGLVVVVGWWLTGGTPGQAWKEFADFAEVRPLRVETQSLTFISPMGDLARYVMSPRDFSLLNFGILAMAGVALGSSAYALATRSFRWEWFADWKDFANHVVGAVLMGIGGVLAMGCTIGQGVTGVSTLALGSLLSLIAMIAGAAATLKFLYWRMTR